MKNIFFSKVLLFGEYGIVKDAMGLSIPYSFYHGKLSFSHERDNTNSNFKLKEYLKYLETQKKLKNILDLKKFKYDIKNGIYFESSIPTGYGIGSSGALVASIYDRYSTNKKINVRDLSRENIVKLKNILAKMEDFFHGKSSGIDPLICYLKIPILINSKDNIEKINIPKENENSSTTIFLVDSGINRRTEDLVKIFFDKLKLDNFKHIFNKFIEYSDDSIRNFLKGDITAMFSNIKELSAIVLANFSPMIPNKFSDVWKKGLENNLFFLKLCGAGGGGFFIGFTKDIKKTQEILKDYKIEIIHKI